MGKMLYLCLVGRTRKGSSRPTKRQGRVSPIEVTRTASSQLAFGLADVFRIGEWFALRLRNIFRGILFLSTHQPKLGIHYSIAQTRK